MAGWDHGLERVRRLPGVHAAASALPYRRHEAEQEPETEPQPSGRWPRRYRLSQDRHSRLLLAVQLAYVVLFTGWLLITHSWPAPDLIAVFLLLFALIAARGVYFLRDWSPFILLLLGYIALTGIAHGLSAHAHVQFPIDVDRKLFGGTLPTLWLQHHLYTPGHPHWYDYVATFMYPMHFVVPLVVAFVFWMWRPRFYWRFVGSYLLLCYAGFLTYLLYPMAPPWWANSVGKLPTVHLVLYEVHYAKVANPMVLATQLFKPNPVAAMPSLHAAFPMLVFLVLWRVFPRWGWVSVIYPLVMAFAVVYMGEHYVIDVLVGFVYALAAFTIVWGRRPRRAPAEAVVPAEERLLERRPAA